MVLARVAIATAGAPALTNFYSSGLLAWLEDTCIKVHVIDVFTIPCMAHNIGSATG
jgi:hypothetical protein